MTERSEAPLQLKHLWQAAVIGVAAGGSALIFEHTVDLLGTARVEAAAKYPVYLLLPICGLVGGLISGAIVQFCAPEISGSGIPQVKAALAGLKMPLTLRIAFWKLTAGVVALGSGLFMGREGPTVHIGAVIGAQLSKKSEHDRHLAAAGAAAGLAAAFNAPLAGVLFVIEELFRNLSVGAITTAAFACFLASVVTNMLHAPHTVTKLWMEHAPVTMDDLVFWPLIGIVGGVLGAGFNAAVMLALRVNKSMKIPTTLKVGLSGLLSGIVVALLPHNAIDYAHLRELVIAGSTPAPMLALMSLAFLFLTASAYGSGAPGGLFAPALTIGSFGGAAVAWLQSMTTGADSMQAFAVLGMGAVFAGVARVPLTAIVIICEMTSQFELMLPLMITCITATLVAEKLYPRSIYDRLVDWAGYTKEEREETGEETKEATATTAPKSAAPLIGESGRDTAPEPTAEASGEKT